jgi:iron complex outermembrane receptor protein
MSKDSKFKRTAAAAAVAAFLACTASAQAQSERPALPADSSQAAAPAPESGASAAEPALAAAAPATGTPAVAEKVQLQDVVVTAQKRTSTAQKTAASITAFDAKTLEKNGVQTLQDLTKLAPGVSLGQDAAKVVVTMRGVSSRDTTEIGDPAVSISSDGFYIQRPTGLSGTVYDLERVEVLRGPQGTLYGRSATGGAINFITAKPGKETEGKFSLGIGNYGTVNTEGMVNLPLNDAWSARAAFKTTRHSGYRTHESPANPGDDDDSTSARVHLQYAPDNRLKVLLTGQYTISAASAPAWKGCRSSVP